jgi:hypothetical protein
MEQMCKQASSCLLRQWYEVLIDPYHKVHRLNLYGFDGMPLPPMYLASVAPAMVPTTTLHPRQQTSTAKAIARLAKRDPDESDPNFNWEVDKLISAEFLWAFGVGFILIVFGAVLVAVPKRKGKNDHTGSTKGLLSRCVENRETIET